MKLCINLSPCRQTSKMTLMAKNLTLILFLLLTIHSSSSSAQTPPSNPVSPSTICKSTPYPSFCNTVLPGTGNSSSTIYDYGRISVKRSLSAAQKFLSLIVKYLNRSNGLTISAIRALEDCKFLAESNIDYLTSSFRTVSRSSEILGASQADDVQALLSAILTNTQTCIDGLQAASSSWSVKNGVLNPLSDDTRLFSVSLALFTRGWVPRRKKKKTFVYEKKDRLPFRNGKFNLRMNNRRLLQSAEDDGGDQVKISEMVIVDQGGDGNFTAINDAVTAAPNNTDGSSGYFLIYVTAGVYEEYVSIPKNKKYLMMIGAGIGETIITGNHSYVDGWTTFNSATFSVVATGFVAVNITFRNTAGPAKHQAVALRSGADLSTFFRCSFEAYQDTLYVHSLRQFYRECDITGTIDFIFGNAAAVFQNCNLANFGSI